MRAFFLTPSEHYVALKSFAVKMLLFCVIEFLICQFDDSRIACRLVKHGFLPPFVVFALMDFLVIPRLHRRIGTANRPKGMVGFPSVFKTLDRSFSCNVYLLVLL